MAFPTAVGMNRDMMGLMDTIQSVPHSRGDEPTPWTLKKSAKPRSPQPWG